MTVARIAFPACAMLLAGCATTAVEMPDTAIAAPVSYAADLPAAGLDEAWWQAFSDPVLDTLIARGLSANLEISAASDRVLAAAALLRAEQGDRLPTIDGSAQIGVERDNDGTRGTAGGGLLGRFDLDLSGRLGAEVRLAAARYAEADYLRSDQRRLVAAAIAAQYVEYRRTGAQLALLEESTELQRQTLRIVTLRFEAGLSANLDVRRAAADLAQTQARLGLIEVARAESKHALAVLLGETPGTLSIPATVDDESAIPHYGAGPAIGGPANLLRRRGDVLAAEARLAAAAAQVGIEQADLRPSLVVPGSILIGDGSLDGLFSSFLATLGAALDLPLFDGGRRRAEVEAARAELEASEAEYRQTFLLALAEAENALVAISAYRQRSEALAEATEQSETALSQSNALYREGLASLFDVLDAQRQLIASRQSLLDNRADLAIAFIALHSAAASADGGEMSGPIPM